MTSRAPCARRPPAGAPSWISASWLRGLSPDDAYEPSLREHLDEPKRPGHRRFEPLVETLFERAGDFGDRVLTVAHLPDERPELVELAVDVSGRPQRACQLALQAPEGLWVGHHDVARLF